jgi:hypothetical protein
MQDLQELPSNCSCQLSPRAAWLDALYRRHSASACVAMGNARTADAFPPNVSGAPRADWSNQHLGGGTSCSSHASLYPSPPSHTHTQLVSFLLSEVRLEFPSVITLNFPLPCGHRSTNLCAITISFLGPH